MKYLKLPGLGGIGEGKILVFDKEVLCHECSYPLNIYKGRLACNSCAIFHKNKEFTGGRLYFERNVSVGEYHDKKTVRASDEDPEYNLARLILDAKEDEKYIPFCAELMYNLLKEKLNEIWADEKKYIICPVPDHHGRSFQKGILLAEEISKKTGIELVPVLEKIKNTLPQHKMKTLKERFENVNGAFSLKEEFKESIKDKNVVLTDDIMSCMATQNECSRILRENGVRSVISVTLGRRILPPEEKQEGEEE